MSRALHNRNHPFLQQQLALARFGELALQSDDLDEILTEACRLIGEALDTDLAKVMQLRDEGRTLFVRAGVGWKPGVVGEVWLDRDPGSSEGRALETGEPVISRDIAQETRFEFADFLKDNGVKALVNVIIIGGPDQPPFGILQVDSRQPRDFDNDDISFLRTYANLLAAAVERIRVAEERSGEQQKLETNEARLRILVEGMPQLVWRAGPDGGWTWSSPQWQSFTGQSADEALHLGWLSAVHPEDRAAAQAAWRDAHEKGVLEAEFRLRDAEHGGFRWHQTRAAPVYDSAGQIVEWLGTSTDIDDLRRLQSEQKVLVAELQHRTRNLIGVVDSLVAQTLKSTASLPTLRDRLHERLQALSRVQGLLSQSHDELITLEGLIRLELEALGADLNSDRLVVQGPAVQISRESLQTLALTIHELATNARKYGALKRCEGVLRITWEITGTEQNRSLNWSWRETGIEVPQKDELGPSGAGHTMIRRSIPHQLQGEINLVIGEDGLICTICLPLKGEDQDHI